MGRGSWSNGATGLLLASGVLRNHAIASLAETYQEAREQAAAETGLPLETFPVQWEQSVDELITRETESDTA